MIRKTFEPYFNKNCRLQFVMGLNSISALACSVAAELVIRSKCSDGYVWSSILALSNNSPAQSSAILVHRPG
jgi:hypothetical protein